MAGFSELTGDPGFWHGLSSGTGHAVPGALRGGYAPERERQAGIFSPAAAYHGSGDRGLHHGFGLRGIRGEGKRQAGAGNAGGFRRSRSRRHRGLAGKNIGDQGPVNRGGRENGVRREVSSPFAETLLATSSADGQSET